MSIPQMLLVYPIIGVIIGCIYLFILFALSDYAKRLGHTKCWSIIAIFFSPIIVFWILYMKGEADEHRKARIIEEEKWRLSISTSEKQETNTTKDIL